MAAETSTSALVKSNGRNDMATEELRDTITQKQWEKDSEIEQANNDRNLLQLMMGVLKEENVEIDGLVCYSMPKTVLFLNFPFSVFLVFHFHLFDQVFFFLVTYLIRSLMKNFVQKISFLCR